MLNNISFEYPYILLLILLFVGCNFFCKAKSATYLIPHLDLFTQASKKSNLVLNILKYITIIGAVIALSSPIKINKTQIIKNDGINIVLNLDASGSMRYKDLQRNKNRFEVVQEVVDDFIEKRVSDNIALVVFGTNSMLASPLSFDKNAQREILKLLEVNMAGEKTALFDSIASSINVLKDKQSKSNIIIILSDGQDTASTIPLEVTIKLLKKYKIKAYTIGIGDSNQYILNEIAKQSGAKAFTIFNKDQLKDVYKNINQLEKSEIDSNKLVLKEYLFFYPLFLAIISLITYIFIRSRD